MNGVNFRGINIKAVATEEIVKGMMVANEVAIPKVYAMTACILIPTIVFGNSHCVWEITGKESVQFLTTFFGVELIEAVTNVSNLIWLCFL